MIYCYFSGSSNDFSNDSLLNTVLYLCRKLMIPRFNPRIYTPIQSMTSAQITFNQFLTTSSVNLHSRHMEDVLNQAKDF